VVDAMSRWPAVACLVAVGVGIRATATTTPVQTPVTIKLATIVPANSPVYQALMAMVDDWDKSTGGRVKLVLYAGGVQGDEPSVVKLMRPGVDGMQAALLTAPGLSVADDAVNALEMPFFLQSDDELQAVLKKLAPVLAKRLDAKGLHVLNWDSLGWIQLFSKKPIRALGDLKTARLFTTSGDDRMVQWYTANGFQPVPLKTTDVPSQLKLSTGLIDAAPMPPAVALVTQVFRDAPNMLDIGVAPLLGATVISNDTWNRIAPDDRAKMLNAAAAMEAKIMAGASKLDTAAIGFMQAQGLKVTKLDAAGAAEFRAAATDLLKTMRGGMVPADVFDLAIQERDAVRKSAGR
jgi:TRAP-type C4-dicarboxylate transport system substrate-binding protein